MSDTTCTGHSSWSASGLCFITWWLVDRLRVFDGSGHAWRLAAAALPAMAALAVGVSRYVDYWHHASDVAAGVVCLCFGKMGVAGQLRKSKRNGSRLRVHPASACACWLAVSALWQCRHRHQCCCRHCFCPCCCYRLVAGCGCVVGVLQAAACSLDRHRSCHLQLQRLQQQWHDHACEARRR